MKRQTIGIIAAVGVAVVIAAVGHFLFHHQTETTVSTNDMPSEAMAPGAKTVPITVGGDGFSPNYVSANKGEPLMLEFTRLSDKTCATKVVFPELGISKDLPLRSAVSVHVPTDRTRQLTFQCGMGMYKSSVVIL